MILKGILSTEMSRASDRIFEHFGVATNQGLLYRRAIIQLFWGTTNQDVLLTEMCSYLRLYRKWVIKCVASNPHNFTPRSQNAAILGQK